MADIPELVNHVEAAVRDLPRVLRKDRMVAFVEALAEGVQALEEQHYQLVVDGGFGVATGVTLDAWGALVGEQRGGLDDDEYRQFITARILVSRGTSTTDELIEIAELITAPSTIEHYDMFPAGFELYVFRETAMSDVHRRRVGRMLRAAKPTGVTLLAVEVVPGWFGFTERVGSLGLDDGLIGLEF